jgi:signal transduction histidine kinase
MKELLDRIGEATYDAILSVPVRWKITGIILLPVVILGGSLNYWITTGLSDWLSFLLTDVRVQAAMQAGGRSVTLVTFLAAAGSIILASLLTFILTRPLTELNTMAQQVAAGNLESRARVWSKDEIGEVAVAINQMTDHLVTTQADLERTNRRLDAINRVILAADREAEIHDVLFAALKSTLDVMRLKTGWIYLRDPERERFHLASWYKVPPELEEHLLHSPEGELCACQADLVSGQVLAGTSIRSCLRLEHCAICDNHTHITIPIEARGERFGVLNLLCDKEKTLSEDDFELLTAVGAQISEITANAWLRLKLAEKEMARQALLESLVRAQEDERGRLARELHDGAGQMLTSLLGRLKTLEKHHAPVEFHDDLKATQGLVSETVEQIRDLSYRLRPATLEQFGLPVALGTLVKDMAEEAGLDTRCKFDLDGHQLTPEIEVTLYRIAQEGLTNVVRHAQASQVEIELTATAVAVFMRIEDDGKGFAPHQIPVESGQRHLGLISIDERASIVGGKLDVYSAPGQGTALHVMIPIPTEPEAR